MQLDEHERFTLGRIELVELGKHRIQLTFRIVRAIDGGAFNRVRLQPFGVA